MRIIIEFDMSDMRPEVRVEEGSARLVPVTGGETFYEAGEAAGGGAVNAGGPPEFLVAALGERKEEGMTLDAAQMEGEAINAGAAPAWLMDGIETALRTNGGAGG